MPDDVALRDHLRAIIMRRVDANPERRGEALRDFLGLSIPGMHDEAAGRLAGMVPPLLPELYEKWIGLFLDRLFETVQRPQIEELCGGSPASEATALLIFVMFLESERMEKQMAADLAAYGLTQSDAPDQGQAVAAALRAYLGRAAKDTQ